MELLKSDSGHHYYTEGQGNPIIFLHGFPDCPENYKEQISFFSSKGYQAIVPYMPGYHPDDAELDTYQSVRLAEEIIKRTCNSFLIFRMGGFVGKNLKKNLV